MPLYDYLCPKGHEFEARRTMKAREACVCPHCGETADKVFSSEAGALIHVPAFFHDGRPSYDEVARDE